jgi:protein gp37
MSEKTGISWTDHTFNPWWGCAHVSPGCANCYAETLAARYGQDVWGKQAPRRIFGDKHWAEPLKWDRQAKAEGRQRRVFCASMADVFEPHPSVLTERVRLWDLVVRTAHLDWQILTKRPENAEFMTPWKTWPPNVWLGTSVEDQQRADERIPVLQNTYGPALRFLSVEPLIAPVTLSKHLERGGIDWIIVGGESGPNRREMKHSWLYRVVAEAQAYGVLVFVKQDSGPRSGMRGDIDPELWALKQYPGMAA